MTEKIKNEEVDVFVSNLFKEDPMALVTFILIVLGKEMIAANAETMDIKTESTLEGKRFEIKCKARIKKIKMP